MMQAELIITQNFQKKVVIKNIIYYLLNILKILGKIMDLTRTLISNRYRLDKKIAEGGMSTIYQASTIHDKNEIFAIKILKTTNTSQQIEDIIRFRSEATIISQINHPNIISIHDFGDIFGRQYMVLEYIYGNTLDYLMNDINELSYKSKINIIMQICTALDFIHSIGIVHRDLKPSNIMLENKKIKLIDFGLAHLKEFNNFTDLDTINGTIGYMSPEQCGMINQNIDEKSDLYSLGIIFYQILTGELPFQGESISSMIHQHTAQIPTMPTSLRNDIPPLLEKITLKLMKKEPANRYQSAKGLLQDLERYNQSKFDFPLGLEDRSIKLSYRTKIIGRKKELKELKNIFNSALTCKGCICLINGEAGVGKSRLVDEFRNYIYSQSGIFIYANCFAGENKTPYGPFTDAMNNYLLLYNKYSENKKKKISKKLKEMTGTLGEIILKVAPQMEKIIGQCPPLIELEPERENKRFYLTISQFLCNLAVTEKIIVLLIDNIHWIDKGALELLNEIAQEISKYPLVIIGTYRQNEIFKDHGLNKFMYSMKDYQFTVRKIRVKPFDQKKMDNFLSDILHDDISNIKKISNIIFQKSKGNPFFSIELLKQLISEKIIYLCDYSWDIDLNKLNNLEISSTLVEIILKKISLLSKNEKIILSYAASIGREFDIKLLLLLGESNIYHLKKNDVIKIVVKAIKLQILDENVHEKGKLFFGHDRIKDALYKNIDNNKKTGLHLEIAKSIEQLNKDNISNVVFDLAYHYIEGKDKEKSLKYAFQAGKKSKEKYANEEALKYFGIAKELLEEKSNHSLEEFNYHLRIKCIEEIGEIYLRTGKFDEAIELYFQLTKFIKSNIKKANTYKQISQAYLKKGDWKKCEKYTNLGLSLLNEKVPSIKTIIILSIIKELLIHAIAIIWPDQYFRINKNNKVEKNKLIVGFYNNICWSYILSDTLKFIRSSLRQYNIVKLRIGKSKELGLAISYYAALCMTVPLFKRALKYHNKSLLLREELNDEWGIAQSLQFIGYCYDWMGKYNDSKEYHNKSIKLFKKIGDLWGVGMSSSGLIHYYNYTSDYSMAEIIADQYHTISTKIKDNYGISSAYVYRHFYMELGDFKKAEYYLKKALDLSYKHEIWQIHCEANIKLGILFLEMGEIVKSLDYLNKSKELFKEHNLLDPYCAYLFVHLADAQIEDYLFNESLLNPKDKKERLKEIKKSCGIAQKKTRKWVSRYCGYLRVKAKYFAIIGKDKKSKKNFILSINLCKKMEKKFEQAKGHYEFGMFLNQTGETNEAKSQFESAYSIFNEIGSKNYINELATILGIKKEKEQSIKKNLEKEKIITILKLGKKLSSINNFDELIKKVLATSIELIGAQRCIIFLFNTKTNELEPRASLNYISNKITIHNSPDVQGDENLNELQYSRTIAGNVFNNSQSITTTNAQGELDYETYHSISEYNLKSIICIPLIIQSETAGVFYLDNPLSSKVFTENDTELINLFLEQLASSIKISSLYNKLNKTIKKKKKILISTPTEEKLKNVIDFINKNYTFDISREGLADSIDVSPDYLSRTFYSYTGKKINEYITTLRINEAAEILKKQNDNIIDIAFSVGFESLRTFNRSFLKVMGETPTQYMKRFIP